MTMKIPELKTVIANYTPTQLQTLVVVLYKAIPKKALADGALDAILKNPDAATAKKEKKEIEIPDVNDLESEIDEFVGDAMAQYYFAPNRIIPKSERPKWRFKVRRFYKDLIASAVKTENAATAAKLLEDLYMVLREACRIWLFNTSEPFESVGVEQTAFFHQILVLQEKVISGKEFISKAMTLLMKESVYSRAFMEDVLSFLRTPDLKYMAIENAEKRLSNESAARSVAKEKMRVYESDERINMLCVFVCRCRLKLREPDAAVEYFEKHYLAQNTEVKLYVLLRMLFEYEEKEAIKRLIMNAEKRNITPRESLCKLRDYIAEHDALPERMSS